MSEKGILYLRPPFPIDQPDPAMEALLKSYAGRPELSLSDDQGRPSATEVREQEPDKQYPWPASRLTSKEMAILYLWRMKTGTPMNELLRQCVQEMQKLIEGKG